VIVTEVTGRKEKGKEENEWEVLDISLFFVFVLKN